METQSIAALKKELQSTSPPQLVELCLRLARYKKENKELLHYLLLEAHDEEGFIAAVHKEVEVSFAEVNTTHVYYAKKSIRKILRNVNKYARYSGNPQTTVELLLFFLSRLHHRKSLLAQSTQLMNLYTTQLKKVEKEMNKLHEDIRYDYEKDLMELASI